MLCPSDSRHMRERKWEKIGYNHDSLLFVMTLQCLHISTIILKVFPPLKEGVRDALFDSVPRGFSAHKSVVK